MRKERQGLDDYTYPPVFFLALRLKEAKSLNKGLLEWLVIAKNKSFLLEITAASGVLVRDNSKCCCFWQSWEPWPINLGPHPEITDIFQDALSCLPKRWVLLWYFPLGFLLICAFYFCVMISGWFWTSKQIVMVNFRALLSENPHHARLASTIPSESHWCHDIRLTCSFLFLKITFFFPLRPINNSLPQRGGYQIRDFKWLV